VECQHCHKMTPVDDAAIAGPASTSVAAAATLQHFTTTHPATPHNNSNTTTISPTNTATSISGIIIMNHDNYGYDNNDNDETAEAEIIRMEKSHLHQRVIHAAIETAMTSSGPTFLWEDKHNLFALCAALPKTSTTTASKTKDGKPPKMSKNVKKLHKILTTKSPHLLHSRSANMWSALGIPDGYTILHAACHVGNVEVLTYLLDNFVAVAGVHDDDDGGENIGGVASGDGGGGVEGDSSSGEVGGEEVGPAVGLGGGGMSSTTRAKLDLNEVDVQGKTALHIAAEGGHTEVIELLKAAYDKSIEQQELKQQQLQISQHTNEVKVMAEARDESEVKAVSLTTPLTMRTPKTPFTSLRSPPPPSSSTKTTPTFAGPRAPVDLSGRTPLGYAVTSPVPKARQNRAAMEKVLYVPGDRSIVGHGGCAERTPPRARCGPSSIFSPSSSLSPMATVAGVGGGASSAKRRGRRTPPPNSSYLSPTPNSGGYLSNYAPKSSSRHPPGSAMSTTSNYATPFQSPPTIFEEEGVNDDNMDYLVAAVGGSSIAERKNCLQWGASEMNGWRVEMEDKILVKYEVYGEESPPPPLPPSLNSTDNNAVTGEPISMGLFGVFDGHGDGGYASNYIATNLWDKLQSQPDWALAYHGCNSDSYTTLLSSIFTQTCHDLDEDLRNDKMKSSTNGGSTAIMALICNRFLFVANVGDSRCILVKKKTATKVKEEKKVATSSGRDELCWDPSEIDIIPMSEDHKPNLPKERARIESAGLTVQTDHVPADDADGQPTVVHRVRKSDTELIGVARAFGDHDFKSNTELSAFQQALVCTPDIVVRERMDDEDMYLILACDGIWDVMSNEEVGEFVARRVAERENWVRSSNPDEDSSNNKVEGEVLARVGDDLLQLCVDKNSRDNMSALIVAFPASGLTSSGSLLPNKSNATMPAVADVAVRTLAYE
jgi:serine/threonine protein phosphatase PrpC